MKINAWNSPILFSRISSKQQNYTTKGKHMKKLLTLTGIASIGAVLALLAACQTTGASRGEIAQKEALLTQSGFKVITVTTPQAATGSQWTCPGQVFGREVQREDCITCFPLQRRIRSTSGNKPNSTGINRRSRRSVGQPSSRPRQRLSKVRRRWQDSL